MQHQNMTIKTPFLPFLVGCFYTRKLGGGFDINIQRRGCHDQQISSPSPPNPLMLMARLSCLRTSEGLQSHKASGGSIRSSLRDGRQRRLRSTLKDGSEHTVVVEKSTERVPSFRYAHCRWRSRKSEGGRWSRLMSSSAALPGRIYAQPLDRLGERGERSGERSRGGGYARPRLDPEI